MAVNDVPQKIQYIPNGTDVEFDFDFKILEDSDLVVYYTVTATDSTTTYILNTDYTVTGAGDDDGGSITCTTAPAGPALGTLTIMRATPISQETDLSTQGPLPADAIEDAIDKVTMIAQDLQEQLDRVDLEPPTGPGGATALTQAAADLRYMKLSGGTFTGAPAYASDPSANNDLVRKSFAQATYVPLDGGVLVTADIGRAADPGNDNAYTRRSFVTDKFNTSTGHDHDGTDAKKIPVTSIDTTGFGAGAFLTANGTGGIDNASRIGSHTTAAAMGTLDVTYREAESTTIYVPRTTTSVMIKFTCNLTFTGVDNGEAVQINLQCMRGGVQIEEVAPWFRLAIADASAAGVFPLTYEYINVPASAATHTFSINVQTAHTGTIATCSIANRTISLFTVA